MELNSPVEQLVHWRSADAVPCAVTYSPAPQFVQALQASPFCAAAKLPSAQALQLRSSVALPSLTTKLPVVHAVLGTHAEAGSESWSHVPAVQASASLAPPAHQL